VLGVTAIAIVLLAPVSLWDQWLGEIQSSVFYFQNWNLAGASVDYLALANQASPVQHFWSLSTEEQFYFFWPLLVAAGIIITSRAVKAPSSMRKTLFVMFSILTAASFAYSVYLTNVDPAVAYFSTPVRAWEFGIGAIAAFLPPVRGKSLKTTLALIGLIGISTSALLITNKTPFPGLAAIFPTLGTAFVIVAAVEAGVVSRIMAWRPIQWIGDKSYAIYLWHWPLLIAIPYVTLTALTLTQKLMIVLATLLLAGLTERFIEKPMTNTKPNKVKVFALTATTSVFIASLSGLAINLGNERIVAELNFGKAGAVALHECFGAAATIHHLKVFTLLLASLHRIHPCFLSLASQ
jgi:peptidoglycan/LPS O-acetylase OafA/YrhL